LNIAAAVQTLCYEIRVNHLDIEALQHAPAVKREYPLNEDLARFYVHLENTLKDVNFIVANHPGMVMTKLRRLFTRARPEVQELNILRGMLASIDKASGNKK
jgi:tRNA (cytidine32/uridine32-2'-O)-methyltransferase